MHHCLAINPKLGFLSVLLHLGFLPYLTFSITHGQLHFHLGQADSPLDIFLFSHDSLLSLSGRAHVLSHAFGQALEGFGLTLTALSCLQEIVTELGAAC